jgi:hypothetical protein
MSDDGLGAVALVYSDNTYGYGLAFNFIASFTKRGGAVPLVIVLNASDTVADAAVAKIKQAAAAKKVDSILLAMNRVSWAQEFLRNATKENIDLPIFAGDGIAESTLFTSLPGDKSILKRMVLTGFNPGQEQFRARFANFTNNTVYHAAAAHAFDATRAFIRAYQAAETPKSGTEILRQLQKEKFDGMSGFVEFDQYGDRVPSDTSYVTNTFDMKTGKLVYGEPIELYLSAGNSSGQGAPAVAAVSSTGTAATAAVNVTSTAGSAKPATVTAPAAPASGTAKPAGEAASPTAGSKPSQTPSKTPPSASTPPQAASKPPTAGSPPATAAANTPTSVTSAPQPGPIGRVDARFMP